MEINQYITENEADFDKQGLLKAQTLFHNFSQLVITNEKHLLRHCDQYEIEELP